MKFRIVAVPLTVALGLWFAGGAFGQVEENIPELVAPAQELFDDALQSELPLQGVLEHSPLPQSIAETVGPRPSAAPQSSDWVYMVRHRFSRAPWPKIGLGVGMLCGLLAAGWTMKSASRRRARRAYQRLPRSSGGSRLQGLEEVVASVQFADSKDPSRRRLPEPATGRK